MRNHREQLPMRLLGAAVLVVGCTMAATALADPSDKAFEELQQQVRDLTDRVGELEAELAGARDRLDTVDTRLEPLDCVRMFETNLGGLPGPHWLFEGCNIHVRAKNDGLATAAKPNGLGNLIVGYNEGRCVAEGGDDDDPRPEEELQFPDGCLSDEECGSGATCDMSGRNGSHNLVVGQQHRFNSFAGILGGRMNELGERASSASGGARNSAAGAYSAVAGGSRNEATGRGASVSGGTMNEASGRFANVSSGTMNEASGFTAQVSGGVRNTARGKQSAVVGGGSYGVLSITGERSDDRVSADCGNIAHGLRSVVVGGCGNMAGHRGPVVVGGIANLAEDSVSVITGGGANLIPYADAPGAVISGGERRTVNDRFDWRGGGNHSNH